MVSTHDARKGNPDNWTRPDDALALEASLVQGLQRQTQDHEALVREVLQREKQGDFGPTDAFMGV